jgi:predicted nucleotidyltransferase
MDTVLSKRRRELKESLRQKAFQRIEQAAALLYAEGAEDVYAFGSVLKPSEFNEHSDVDIAVNGIPEEKRIEVEGRLEDIFADVPFDIIFLEEPVRPEIRAKIRREGIKWKR